MPGIRERAERYFEFEALGTNWRTEVLAGTTTFMTMAYIVFVNPAILSETGMPLTAVTAATCLSAAFGSLLMGLVARYPIALAPGMGLNAYFTYSVVKGMGIPWQTALGAVFLSGVAFLILTALGVRQLIVKAIPRELYAAVAAGVGLFIALIGFRNSGIIVPDAATTVALGNLRDPKTALALFGLLSMAALLAWRVRAAILIGIVSTTVLGILTGVARWQPQAYSLSGISATAFQLDVRSALGLGAIEIVFVFLFVDLFDNVGTLVAVGKKAGLLGRGQEIPRINRVLFSDAAATIAGSLAGTSAVVSYVESSAGVAAGGRSGVTAIVTALLFVAALFLAPLIGVIPASATAPALIIVGSMMMTAVTEIAWTEPQIAIPAFLTMLAIPLTFSIANGLAFGFTAYTLLKMLRGQFREVNWVVYVLTALFVVRFFYLGAPALAANYDLLVEGAADSELGPLVAALEGKQQVQAGAWTYWTGKIGRKSVVIARTEMGPINAAASTTIAIERFHPAAIIDQGTAGAHDPELKIWDIVLGTKTVDYGAFKSEEAAAGAGSDPARWKPIVHEIQGTRYPAFLGDEKLIAMAKAVPYSRARVREGTIGSAYEFNREVDRIAWLRKTYGTDTEDMESVYIAGVAKGMHIPFLAIRIISDSEYTHPKYEEIAGQYCAEFVRDLIRSMK